MGFDVWAQVVAELNWDASTSQSLVTFWTASPAFGLFLIVKTFLLSWGVWSWIKDYKHFTAVTRYSAFCDAATGCNPTEEWLLENASEDEEGEEGEEVDGEEVDGEESGDESAEEEAAAEPCVDFFGNGVACEPRSPA